MLQTLRANLFELGAETLVHPSNLQGVMRVGAALQFRRHFPLLVPAYESFSRLPVNRSKLHIWEHDKGWPFHIVSVPVRENWNGPVCDILLKQACEELVKLTAEGKIRKQIAIPQLVSEGAHSEQWPRCLRVMEEVFNTAAVDVTVALF